MGKFAYGSEAARSIEKFAYGVPFGIPARIARARAATSIVYWENMARLVESGNRRKIL